VSRQFSRNRFAPVSVPVVTADDVNPASVTGSTHRPVSSYSRNPLCWLSKGPVTSHRSHVRRYTSRALVYRPYPDRVGTMVRSAPVSNHFRWNQFVVGISIYVW